MIYNGIILSKASQVAQWVKNLPAKQETRVWSLGWEDPLEEGMADHSSILAWEIPGTEEPSMLQSKGSQRVGHDWNNWPHMHVILSNKKEQISDIQNNMDTSQNYQLSERNQKQKSTCSIITCIESSEKAELICSVRNQKNSCLCKEYESERTQKNFLVREMFHILIWQWYIANEHIHLSKFTELFI